MLLFQIIICSLSLLCAFVILNHPPAVPPQKTLAIIKPGSSFDSREQIQRMLEDHHFHILDALNLTLDPSLAHQLYHEHLGKPFYDDLISYITTAPVQVLLLQRHNAIAVLRSIMPDIRTKFGQDTTRNAIHGSDSLQSAQREISLFFALGEHS